MSGCGGPSMTTVIKQLAAISLITLLIFNWYGYRLLIIYFEKEATSHLQAKLDNNEYDESSLVQIRVPLNMPYIADWNDFEKYEGETEINGIHYRYVKRKIEKGELVLLCIPNHEKTSLQSAEQSFFKVVNDIHEPAAGKKESKSHTVKLALSDYITEDNKLSGMFASNNKTAHSSYSYFIPPSFITTPSQPPEC